ncbi:MAG: hypothetical protein COT81_05625 [Candidatus Buchananbacteria bacterium CG10_big_fil_rev_8_21_14_0_10_42_9]|uniref:Helix-turn-helix domain-containing protein n=1 Tax=Candidatus Buchananbacteria bacterium CG10_big_fil_rev_8_21_14_0_10_42_9 TaxID=1974526 RepID=A0A2H0VZT9_9BACT|nr:MAG: hypothetical protein COT81_05625 [Candidatus Buchananbacteria bacterium CG10_big_fil_rev_8_21_14_0_10_42_9]
MPLHRDNILTLEEVAEVFKVSMRTVYRWVASGELEVSKIGHKTYRVFESDVIKFMKSRRMK